MNSLETGMTPTEMIDQKVGIATEMEQDQPEVDPTQRQERAGMPIGGRI